MLRRGAAHPTFGVPIKAAVFSMPNAARPKRCHKRHCVGCHAHWRVEALILQKFRHKIRDGAISFLFARDRVEALAALKANGQIDLVVTDINMPRMDGLSLLQKLQENEKQVSTIIVSAYGDMGNIRAAMNRGAFDFVTKPIDFQDLQTTIAKTLRHIELLRDARQRQAVAE